MTWSKKLALFLLAAPSLGLAQESDYFLEVVVDAPFAGPVGNPAVNLTDLDLWVGINDAGRFAFTGQNDSAGGSQAFVAEPSGEVRPVTYYPASSSRLFQGACLSDEASESVAVRDRNGSFYKARLWDADTQGSFTQVGASGNDFDTCSLYGHVNGSGVMAFSALTGGSTVTQLLAGNSQPPTVLATWQGNVHVRPQISDTNRVVTRDNLERIMIFEYPSGSATVVASGADGFLSTESQPGISGEGRAVAFEGDRGSGAGVFLAVDDLVDWEVFSLVGEGSDDFTDIATGRVGVTSKGDPFDGGMEVTVVFVGTRGGVVGLHSVDAYVELGDLGQLVIQASRHDDSAPEAQWVTKVGDEVLTLDSQWRTVSSLRLYDPINRHGVIGFHAGFSEGGEGVVRARRRQVHALVIGVDDEAWFGVGFDGAAAAERVRSALLGSPQVGIVDLKTYKYSDDGLQNWEDFKQRVEDSELLMEPGDLFVLYMASHGTQGDGPGDELPIDIRTSPLHFLTSSNSADESFYFADAFPVPDDMISELFNTEEWDEVDKLFLMDCCFSGGYWGTDIFGDSGDFATLPRAGMISSTNESTFSYSTLLEGGISYFALSLEKVIPELSSQGGFSFEELASAISDDRSRLFESYSNLNGDFNGYIQSVNQYSQWFDDEVLADVEVFSAATSDFNGDVGTCTGGCGGDAAGTAYCFGDGLSTPCPCSNDNDGSLAAGEAGCRNGSSPGGAVLSASGSLSVSAADLVFAAEGLVPQQPGLLFQGLNAVNAGSGEAFGDGLRCAGGGVLRLGVLVGDASGLIDSAGLAIGQLGAASAGDLRRYQFWYRDPAGSPCAAGFNLTNGVEIVWEP